MLDLIMSTLSLYYQSPVCLLPLDHDPDKNGSPSDHLIVIMRPINQSKNKPGRTFRVIRVRPLPRSRLEKFEAWIKEEDWSQVLNAENVDKKAETLHNMVLSKLDEVCPEKIRKIANDDQSF